MTLAQQFLEMNRTHKPFYKVVTWHGESGSIFYIVDVKAEDIEVVATYQDNATAQRECYKMNYPE